MKRILVIALVAAGAVAATSFAYAAIPSASGVISACKDSKGSLKVIDAEAGQTCNPNQQLLAWNEQGPAGQDGQDGQDGVSGYVVVTEATDQNSDDFKALDVQCPPGKVVVGGGGALTEGGGAVTPGLVSMPASFPAVDDTGWVAVAEENAPTNLGWKLTVRAICISAALGRS